MLAGGGSSRRCGWITNMGQLNGNLKAKPRIKDATLKVFKKFNNVEVNAELQDGGSCNTS